MALKLKKASSDWPDCLGERKKLQGSQTWTKSTQTLVQFGRRKKLQGSQTDVERIKSFGSRRNYRVLKHTHIYFCTESRFRSNRKR